MRSSWESSILVGPFVLHNHLFNTRTGSVFRVTDKNSNVYALKVFTYGENAPVGHKERRLYDYANERSTTMLLTKAACPTLLDSLSDKSKFGSSVTCANHHIQVLLGLDVPVMEQSDSKTVLGTRKMRLMNSKGEETDRNLDFKANTLLPFMAGGRLSDLVSRVPKYQSMVVRYPLYVDVAPQMVDALRFMHSQHIAHLGVQASTILCSSVNCEDAVLSDPSTAWNGAEGTQSAFASELMQPSVRFAQFVGEEKTESSEVTKQFAQYLRDDLSWEGTLKVDWYGLGGALFYILAGIRPVAEDRRGPNSHDVAEFIYKALQSQRLLGKVPSEDAKKALAHIRDQVAEGLLLVDGLLQTDRSKRISFDPFSAEASIKTRSKLRSSKNAISVLQTEAKSSTTSCSAFMAKSVKESDTLAALPVNDRTNLPSFLQDICQ
jgi:serine/threonine protein kinase